MIAPRLFYLVLIFPLLLNAQTSNPIKSKTEIDSIVLSIKETFDIPGLAVGVIKNGEIYYSNAMGVQDVITQKQLTTKSLFHMASVSKPFVATAIVQLVEKGEINLNKKLIEYLPYFKMADNRYKSISIQQILNHSSGIPDVEDYEWDNPQYDENAAERYTLSFSKDSLDFEPGTEFNYSNAAYDILADVISKVSGMSFENYMKKYIFEPSKMTHSTFYKPDVPDHLATKPHHMNGELQMDVIDVYPYNRIHAPSSTLHSNVEDMLHMGMLYLNQGVFEENIVFNKQAYDLLTTSTKKINKSRSICLGWFHSEIEGEPVYYHSGGDEGYRTFFMIIPTKKSAIVMMGNNDYFKSSKAAVHLVKEIVFETTTDWKKQIDFELKHVILSEGIESAKKLYHNLKKKNENQYDFGYLDNLGYWLLDRNKNKEALDIFLFNIELNPEESGFYDSVGDAYLAMKNKGKAIEWYEKALKLNPEQDFTIEKLKKLKQ